MAVVREKEVGTMEQIIVTPITPVEFILGKTVPFALIAFIDVSLVSLVGVYWFGVPVRGSLALAVLLDRALPDDRAGVGSVHLHDQRDPAAGDDEHVLLLLPGDAPFGLCVPHRQHAPRGAVAGRAQSLGATSW